MLLQLNSWCRSTCPSFVSGCCEAELPFLYPLVLSGQSKKYQQQANPLLEKKSSTRVIGRVTKPCGALKSMFPITARLYDHTAGMPALTPYTSAETPTNLRLSGKHIAVQHHLPLVELCLLLSGFCFHSTCSPAVQGADNRPVLCREAEVIHSRWAMLGVLGLIIPDVLGAPLYMLPELGTERLLPFTIIVVVAFGGLEAYRVQSILQGRDLNSRVYPGGERFDPLGLAKGQQAGQKEARSPGKPLTASFPLPCHRASPLQHAQMCLLSLQMCLLSCSDCDRDIQLCSVNQACGAIACVLAIEQRQLSIDKRVVTMPSA